ncbi:MAG: ATP-dependent Clp protease proteolytic subunit [bacterium]|nr:ATP-dependent Clp protease proteolytic subunit [bacterium]
MKYNADTFFITFVDSINEEKVKTLIAIIADVIHKNKPSQIYILFSSGGGGINAGITLYNFLRALPTEVVFHNIGSVDSIATCIFLAGNKRYASSNSNFLFHGVTWTFGQGAALNRKQLHECISTIQQNENDYANIITSRTSISKKEIFSLLDQGESKGLEFALEKGIIHEVCEVSIPTGYNHIACNLK